MADKKSAPFAIIQILAEHSDADHILNATQIIKYLKQEYDLDIERRTIYSTIPMLQSFNYDISDFEDNGVGYYLREREFTKPEVLLLANAIHASHFISSSQSDKLIQKLLKTLSVTDRKEFSDHVYLPNSQKTSNDSLMKNIKRVSEAIRDSRTIKFEYLKYDDHKKLMPRREELYTVQPRYIVYHESRPYVIVTSANHDGFSHYRLDRMANVRLTRDTFSFLTEEQDAYEYARAKHFMFTGDNIRVTLRVHESILDAMIDTFGKDVMISRDNDKKHLIIRTTSTETGILLFAQQYLDKVQIVEPVDLREKLKKRLLDALDEYK